MARFLRSTPRSILSSSLLKPPPPPTPISTLTYPRPSAFDANLLRRLRSDIDFLATHRPPLPPLASFKSFAVEDRPGEQWVRLRARHGGDDVRVDATMFDGAVAGDHETGPRLHLSLIVEVSRRGEEGESVLGFICSAWPDSLAVEKVFPLLRRKGAAVRPYLGRDFRELDEGVRGSVRRFLQERGVDDDLAEFLHEYMANREKLELLRWLKIVESYVEK